MPSWTFIAQEEKSIPGFKASKDRLTLSSGANVAGDFKLKPMLIYHTENPRALKNYVKLTLPVLQKWNNKAWMTAPRLTKWFAEYFKPTVENYYSEKRFLSKYYCSLAMHFGHPRALMEMYN